MKSLTFSLGLLAFCQQAGLANAQSDPCDPSPCAVNTVCTPVEDGDPECICPEGFYIPEEGGCIPVEVDDPCDPNPCAVNTVCTPVEDGDPECICPDGFFIPEEGGCVPIEVDDPCDPNPCAVNTVCTPVEDGDPECICPDGFMIPEEGGCIPIEVDDPCDPNPCAVNTVCTPVEDGDPECICPEGFFIPDEGGCEPIEVDDPCGPNLCAVNTVCTPVEDGDPECICPDGFFIPEEGGCVPVVDGGMIDDPHIQTWNNTWFDWQGQCDVVLVHAPRVHGVLLQIHVRTTIRYDYSYIEAAAVRLGEDVVEVTSFGGYALNGVETANLDDVAIAAKFPVYRRQINKKETTLDIVLGVHQNITLGTFKDLVSVKIHGATPKHFGDSVGIMGSFGGQLLARDGKTTMDEDLNAFGQEWQVQPGEASLFRTVRAPQAPNQCIFPSTQKKTVSLRGRRLRNSETISWDLAAQACKHLGNGARKEACISDVIAVGDLDIGRAAW